MQCLLEEKMLEAKTIRRKSKIKVKRPVKCVETGKVYASSTDAADILSSEGWVICPRAILSNCQGKQKTAGGFRWEYG
jgi:hypothetical protein